MLRVAAFIDAGYLWRQLWKALCPDGDGRQYLRSNVELTYVAFHDVFLEYIAKSFVGIPFLRCYWYDGPLASGNSSAEHQKIASLNDFKLRLGHRATETVDGRTKQKGVDGLIIADLISLAQNKVISHALLISGDGDMVPGVGVAQALGVRVHLLTVSTKWSTSPNLEAEVDHCDSWQLSDIKGFARLRGNVQDACPPSPDFTPPPPQPPLDIDKKIEPLPPDVGVDIERCGGLEAKTADAQHNPLDFCSDVAIAVFAGLSDEEKVTITSSFIPYPIDRQLLRVGYEKNDCRALKEGQKRALRANLRNVALRDRESK